MTSTNALGMTVIGGKMVVLAMGAEIAAGKRELAFGRQTRN